jgi:hypothetical protein
MTDDGLMVADLLTRVQALEGAALSQGERLEKANKRLEYWQSVLWGMRSHMNRLGFSAESLDLDSLAALGRETRGLAGAGKAGERHG